MQVLISFCATPGRKRIPWDTYGKFIEELKLLNPALQDFDDPKSKIPTRVFVSQRFGGELTIAGLLGTCALNCISVVDLLLRPKEAASKQLVSTIREYEPLPLVSEKIAPLRAYVADLRRGPFRRYEGRQGSSKFYTPSNVCLEKIIRDAAGFANESVQESRHDYEVNSDHGAKGFMKRSLSKRHRADRVFEIAFRAHVSLALNPFASFERRGAIEVVCNEAGVDEDTAIWFLKSAAVLRQSIERVKARFFGLGYWELKDYEVFSGIISGISRRLTV